MVDTRFEAAADAIQWGELAALRDLLGQHPALASMRSPFVHRATLLHHVAANGIEAERQLQSPPNAREIMRLLLERGAEPDALCETYGGGRGQTALCLLVSSCVPAAAGVQAALVEELCGGGARMNGLDDDGLPLWTAVIFGYTGAAEALVRCGARVDHLVLHAALGNLAAVRGHGRREVTEFLLEKGPDLTVAEPCFGATARGAARYQGYTEIAALIEARLPAP